MIDSDIRIMILEFKILNRLLEIFILRLIRQNIENYKDIGDDYSNIEKNLRERK